jgi:hypothetical protein
LFLFVENGEGGENAPCGGINGWRGWASELPGAHVTGYFLFLAETFFQLLFFFSVVQIF